MTWYTDTHPRVVADLDQRLAHTDPTTTGAVWRLDVPARVFEADLMHLPPGEHTETVREPAEVLLLPLAGTGIVHTDAGDLHLAVHALTFLPRGSLHSLEAGPDGLAYLSLSHAAAGARAGTERRWPGPQPCPRCAAPAETAVGGTCSNCGTAISL